MKSLGTEEVCEIGKWKGVEAFEAYYQRLGAQKKNLENSLFALVHNRTSLGLSAEPEVSRTPPRFINRGGSDTEGEAQGTCEPTYPPRKRSRSLGSQESQTSSTTPRVRRWSTQSANSGKKSALRDIS